MNILLNKIKYSGKRLKDSIKKRKGYSVICVLAGFYLLNNFIWLSLNAYPGGPDEFAHLTLNKKILSFFSAKFSLTAVKDYLQSSLWPPFLHFSSAVLNLFWGNTYLSSVMVNIPYLIVLLFAVYFIGLKLFNKETAVWAVIFLALYPMIFIYSRYFNPDFALTAMVSLGMCFLLYSDNFRILKFSLLFGFSLGLGMLTKWTFILFLSGPMVYSLLTMFFPGAGEKNNRRKRLTNFFVSLSIGIFLCLSWYILAFPLLYQRGVDFFMSYFRYHPRIDSVLTPRPLLQAGKFFDYPLLMINEGMSFLFFTVFITAALAGSMKTFRGLLPLGKFIKVMGNQYSVFLKHKDRFFLFLWVFVPYFILSLSFQKEGRFILPLLPAIALVSAAGLSGISSRKKHFFERQELYLVIVFLGLLQFFDISYNYKRENNTFPLVTPIGVIQVFYSPVSEHHDFSFGPPFKKDWKMREITEALAGYYKKMAESGSLNIGLICADAYSRKIFNYPSVMDYYLAQENVEFNCSFLSLIAESRKDSANFLAKSNELDGVIFISGDKPWPEFSELKEVFNQLVTESISLQQARLAIYGTELVPGGINKEDADRKFREFLEEKDSKFRLIDKIALREGYAAYIYARKAVK